MSDYDLIRRGDAKSKFSGRGLAFVRSGLDAIPAVQPTVKPLGADGVTIHPQDILNAAWRDDLGEEGLAMYARILSVLDMQPTVSPDVVALVEALESAVKWVDQYRWAAPWVDQASAALARVKENGHA